MIKFFFSAGLLAASLCLLTMAGFCQAGDITLTVFPQDLLSLKDTVTVSWAENIPAILRYARARGDGRPESYPHTIPQVIASPPGSFRFVPDEQLSPGVYYCLVSDGVRSSPEFVLAISSAPRRRHLGWNGPAKEVSEHEAMTSDEAPAQQHQELTLASTVEDPDGAVESFRFRDRREPGPYFVKNKMSLLSGTVTNHRGQAVGQAQVMISNGNKTFSGQTDALGYYAFSLEPGEWQLMVEINGYADRQVETLAIADANMEHNLVLMPRACLVSGRIMDGRGELFDTNLRAVPLAGALISLEDDLGTVFCDTTDARGEYALRVPPGSYSFWAEREGYEPPEAQEVHLPWGGLILPDVILHPEEILTSFWGTVTWGPDPLSMAEVAIWSPSQDIWDTTWTEDDGSYLFEDLPANDNYLVEVFDIELEPLSSGPIWLTSQGAQWDFHYPVGQIGWLITDDGRKPLSGAEVHLMGPGVDTTLCADGDGYCQTSACLQAGEYQVRVAGAEEHIPPPPYVLRLGEDEVLTEAVNLPIRHALTKSTFSIGEEAGICAWVSSPDSTTQVHLYYREPGEEDFSRVAMIPQEATSGSGETGDQDGTSGTRVETSSTGMLYRGTIPAQSQAGAIEYFIEAQHGGHLYSQRHSPQVAIISSLGVPHRADIFCEQKRPQTGRPSAFQLKVYDQMGSDLSFQLTEKDIAWSVLEGPGQIEKIGQDPTQAIYLSQETGQARIEAAVNLNGTQVSAQIVVANRVSDLDRLEIIGPAQPWISNQSQATFRAVAHDASGGEIDIRPRWDFHPVGAGILSRPRGDQEISFTPNDDFIGQVRISLTDSISGWTVDYNAADSLAEWDQGLSVYHLLRGDAPAVTLGSEDGFGLIIPSLAISPGDSTIISLRQPSAPDVKRSTRRHQVQGQIYELRSSDCSSFLRPVEIILPVSPKTQSLEPVMGWWDARQLEWVALAGTLSGDRIAAEVDHFSQFAVLTVSEPLALEDVQLLPNPFTAHDPHALQLGFTLSTNRTRKPFVTIRVYNMTGQLVRTICENEPVPKGRYAPGDSFLDSRGRDITIWDGRTNSGEMARNGRYLLHFKATDSSGSVEALKTAVLIK